MFQLTWDEVKSLRSQFVTLKKLDNLSFPCKRESRIILELFKKLLDSHFRGNDTVLIANISEISNCDFKERTDRGEYSDF